MKHYTREEVLYLLNRKNKGNQVDFTNSYFSDLEFDNQDFTMLDFSWSTFHNVVFTNCKFDLSVFDHCVFENVCFDSSSLVGTSLVASDLRTSKLSHVNIDCADFTNAILIGTILEDINYTYRTVNFNNVCPIGIYFYAYKKCFNNRLVKLLIPKDARVSSATSRACRCDKAKVIAITNLDGSGSYSEASSYVDDSFIYKLGEMIYADDYDDDVWRESTHGIHFWVTKEEALSYM